MRSLRPFTLDAFGTQGYEHLDDEALAEAMRLMGVTTKKETVNAALRDYVARIKRLDAAEKLAARGARGEFEQAAAAHDAGKRARREAFE